jgi:hypothetical protein
LNIGEKKQEKQEEMKEGRRENEDNNVLESDLQREKANR